MELRIIALMPNMYKRKVCETLDVNKIKALNENNRNFKVLIIGNGGYVYCILYVNCILK